MNSKNIDLDRLGKIVKLAKDGVGGEKQNALRIVKKICDQHGLDFEEVMTDVEAQEFCLEHKKGDENLAIQIICRFGKLNADGGIYGSKGGRHLYFTSTKEKYIEVENAYNILSKQMKKERQRVLSALDTAFYHKHLLFYIPTPEEEEKIRRRIEDKEKNKTDQEKRDEAKNDIMAAAMQDGLESVNLLKQLK